MNITKLLLKTIVILIISIVLMAPESTIVGKSVRSVLFNQEDNDYQNFEEINCDWPMHEGWPYELGGGQYIQSVAEDLDNDGIVEVIVLEKNILTILTPNANPYSSAWPKPLPNTYWLAIGNLDFDIDLEIIAAGSGSSGGGTHVFNINGSYVAGWPKDDLNGGITLSDLDNDGVDEIIYTGPGEVSVLNADGTNYSSGWPIHFDQYSGFLAVGDIDNDGYEEIVIEVGMISSNENYVYAYNHNGTLVNGEWPFYLEDDFVVSEGPVLGDFDQDGLLEISFATYENKVYVLNKNGEIFNSNWPIILPQAVYWSIALGNIDDHYGPEILVSGKTPYIYAIDSFGSILPGWPAEVDKPSSNPFNPFQNRLHAIGDVDSDGLAEILVGALVGPYIFNNDSTAVVGADPMLIENDYSVNSYHWGAISLADINNDNSVDVLISIWGQVYAYDFDGFMSDIEWRRYQCDLALTGAYNSPISVDAGGPYEGFVGELVCFNGSVSGGEPPYNWSWDFGDGNTSDEQNPNYVYSEVDEYDVTLTVTDSLQTTDDDVTTASITEDTTTELEIMEITGGFDVSVIINNTGENDAINMTWNIKVTGGFLGRIDADVDGNKSKLGVDKTETAKTGSLGFLHLGPLEITVTIEADNTDKITAEATAFIIGLFVLTVQMEN